MDISMKGRGRHAAVRNAKKGAPFTLAIDIGGTHLKASVLDRSGTEVAKRVEVATPHPAPPQVVLSPLEELAQSLPKYDRVSAGFPGVVKHGEVMTAPNLGFKFGSAETTPSDIRASGVLSR